MDKTTCPGCGLVVARPRTDDDGTAARAACRCEAREPCARLIKNKPCPGRVVQVTLLADGRTIDEYLCGNHAIAELLDGLPEALPDEPAPKAPAATPAPLPPPEPVGRVVEEHSYLRTKKAAEEDLARQQYRVKCLDCGKVHQAATRKLVGKEPCFSVRCPTKTCLKDPEKGFRYMIVE